MTEHHATIRWEGSGTGFLQGRYSREHTWEFDGGVRVPASPSPAVVPAPWSNAAAVDPEEAFVAAVSSCHMLTWLFLAGRRGFTVVSYVDEAVGEMTRNEKGIPWVSAVTLHPRMVYGPGTRPTPAEEAALHHEAHEQCYIANSIRTAVRVLPPRALPGGEGLAEPGGGPETENGGFP